MKKELLKKRMFLLIISIVLCAYSYGQKETYTFSDSWGNQGMTLLNSKSSGVDVNFSINDFALVDKAIEKNVLKSIEIYGNLLPNDEGAPDLPSYATYVALPDGATAVLEIVNFRKEIIKNVDLAPAPDIPFVIEDKALKYEKDQSIYSKDAFYPEKPFQISKKSVIRGVEMVTLGITPFQYNPVTKELIVYRDIELKVNFSGGKGTYGDERLRSRWFDPILKNTFLNYSSLPEVDYNHKAIGKSTGYEYLIIVPDDADFIAWADTIKKFRTLQGINTGVVTITDIGGNNVSTIKNYIDNAYNNWSIPPAAVLIMADYGTSGVGITSQEYSHPYSGTYITDNYYADVVNNDGLPDIAFARMTAQNATHLETMVTKFINYEMTPPTSTNFYNNPITACGWQTERWFQLCSEIVGGYLKEVHGKSPVRINEVYSGTPGSIWSTATNTDDVVNYFGPNGLGYIPASPSSLGGWTGGTTNDVVNAINSGAFMLQHRDHGAYYGWGEPDFRSADIDNLTNTDLPFVFSINCLTGQFDYTSECFAEKFHRYTYNGNNSGALGLIAATQVSYSFVNDAFTWGMYDYMWSDFMPDYSETNLNVTPATLLPGFASVNGKYFLYQSSWPYNTSNKAITYDLFHLHGDAFTMLYSEVPQNLNVSHASELLTGETTFSVTADNGSFIALTVDGNIIGTAEGTGSSVAITIPAQAVGNNLIVTITKQNYYRYSSTVPVTGTVVAPVADFTASSTTIYEGESITFTDQSTNVPTSWSWTLNGGNPATSSDQNPVITYNTAGTYEVSLTVTNSAGSDTETKSNYITVNVAPPNAAFTENATIVYEGESVMFTDQSTNNPTSWSWIFGGGDPSTSTAQNPSVVYNTAGTYDVSLTVANSVGSDTETKTAHITVNPPVTCTNLPYNESFENTTGNWVQETNDDIDWTVQTGSTTSSNTGPSGAVDGSYYIYIEASSPNYPGKVANITSPCFDLVGITNPVIEFQYHMYGSAMGTLNVQISTDGGANWTTEWTMSGDQGNSWYTANIDMSAYIGRSNVLVRLNGITGSSYTSDICIDAFEIKDNVVIAPVAEFTASSTTVYEGESVIFTDASLNNPTSWSWTFSGGTLSTSTDQNPTVVYSAAGTYDVSLTVTNSAGSNSITKTGYITVQEGTVSYCTSESGNYNYEYIGTVEIGSYTNTSGGSYYTDYTSEIVSVVVGSNSVTLTPVFPGSTYNENWRIWIDFNKDGDFEDADEEVFAPAATSSAVSGTFNVPSSFSGQTRMRISMKWNGVPTPCESFSYGEVEDYTVSTGTDAIDNSNSSTDEVENMELEPIAKQFNVYPNPAGKELNIELTGYGDNTIVKVIDVNGRVMDEFLMERDHKNLSIEHYHSGVYLIVVQSNDKVETKRVIKE